MIRPYFAMGRKPKKKKLRKTRRVALILIILTALGAYMGFLLMDRRVLPVVIAIAEQVVVVEINDVINQGLDNVIGQANLVSEDFFDYSLDGLGRISAIFVDTLLINRIAADLAVDISYALSADVPMSIGLPAGLLTGVGFFAGVGPNIGVNVIPSGEATVEYETSFTTAVINQVNFQVWLTIRAQMRVMVPLQEEEVYVYRRVALVNTVFTGEIPPNMLLPIPN